MAPNDIAASPDIAPGVTTPDGRTIGDVILNVEDVSLAFGGVKALSNVSFNVLEGEVRAIIGPNGAGKSSMLNCINGFYKPTEGTITFKGQSHAAMETYEAANQGIARTFQNIALFRGMTTLDNIMTGRNLQMKTNFIMQALYYGPALKEELSRPTCHRLPGNSSDPENRCWPPSLRSAKTRRTGPGPGVRAGHAVVGRTHGRHEPRGKRGHVPLHPRRER